MTKIFKRDTLISGVSPKMKDEKKRKEHKEEICQSGQRISGIKT